jgi:hypothetical protein
MSPTPHPTTRIGARSTLPQQAIGGLGTRQSGGSIVDIDGFSLFSLCGWRLLVDGIRRRFQRRGASGQRHRHSRARELHPQR